MQTFWTSFNHFVALSGHTSDQMWVAREAGWRLPSGDLQASECVIVSVCVTAIVDVHPHVSQIKTENKPRNAIQIGKVGDS